MARLLIIEDNPDNLELMCYLLKAFGHTIATARDGAEGVEAARANSVDLIVCDVHLPKMDGYEVAHALKADPALRKIPLVAVTALAMVGDRDKLMASGFDGYLAKPIDPQTFVKQVEAFLPKGSKSSVVQSAPTLPEPVPSGATRAPSPTHAHVLVVDDSAANRELTRAILEPFGYQLSLVASAKAAIALAAKTRFDLILSDLHMPFEDGLNLLTTVKADPRLHDIPFILISSSSRSEVRKERALKLGAVRFLLRPMEPQQLLNEVAACLKQMEER